MRHCHAVLLCLSALRLALASDATTTVASVDATTQQFDEEALIMVAVEAGEEAAKWTWPAAAVTFLGFCCCCAPALCAGLFSLTMLTQRTWDPRVSAARQAIHQRVHRELLVTLSLPFVAAGMWYVLAGIARVPEWAQGAIILPVVLRTCYVDTSLTRRAEEEGQEGLHRRQNRRANSLSTPYCLGKGRKGEKHKYKLITGMELGVSTPTEQPEPTKLDMCRERCHSRALFLASKVDVVDAVTNGMCVVVVHLLQDESALFRERLLTAWGAGPVGRLFAPLVMSIGLSGLMLVTLAVATSLQLFVGVSYGEDAFGFHITSDIAGLGSLADSLKPDNEEEQETNMMIMTHIGRVLFERAPQLMLQTSAVMAEGGGLLAQPALAVSISLTSLTTMVKFIEMMRPVCATWTTPSDERQPDFLLLAASGLVPLIIPACVAAVFARLILSEQCASKMYDLSSLACLHARMPGA